MLLSKSYFSSSMSRLSRGTNIVECRNARYIDNKGLILLRTTGDYFSVGVVVCVCDPASVSEDGGNAPKSCFPTTKADIMCTLHLEEAVSAVWALLCHWLLVFQC